MDDRSSGWTAVQGDPASFTMDWPVFGPPAPADTGFAGRVFVLDRAGITVNKNTVPKETESPFVTSGIRIGTAAVTTRGMKEADMRTIAGLIDRVLKAPDDKNVAAAVKKEVEALAAKFPLYPAQKV